MPCQADCLSSGSNFWGRMIWGKKKRKKCALSFFKWCQNEVLRLIQNLYKLNHMVSFRFSTYVLLNQRMTRTHTQIFHSCWNLSCKPAFDPVQSRPIVNLRIWSPQIRIVRNSGKCTCTYIVYRHAHMSRMSFSGLVLLYPVRPPVLWEEARQSFRPRRRSELLSANSAPLHGEECHLTSFHTLKDSECEMLRSADSPMSRLIHAHRVSGRHVNLRSS